MQQRFPKVPYRGEDRDGAATARAMLQQFTTGAGRRSEDTRRGAPVRRYWRSRTAGTAWCPS